ncbi:4-alpha-glucanotransferase [Thiobacillus denitrificans ATCC 25259]|uniref:4-alpha-glucanotransferase n=1 Tax=Thiobacillus denitrificans (strain ATCC 25259 / T1) TaxID=292415 RepID=Q3SH77_THIDA|nr:4-alpha-glucanotransferase [Thiobacillus denitrificans]AAZ98012.1 4-alpha-glucanotransferase [Thiobacillus denitrificans ATCC 25259]
MNFSERRAGILLHPTSLPSGTFADAERWLDFLHDAGFGVWQMLPLGLPLTGLSPYQCASAFAVDPALFPGDTADPAGFEEWHHRQRHWIDDYARFTVIKAAQGGAAWTDWPPPLRDREPAALAEFERAHADALRTVMHDQYRAAQAGRKIRAAAAARGIRLFGDMPIFVAHDSADVWAQRHLFLLDGVGHPTVVAGVPPDYFSETGQRWGNPHYDWDAMQADGFAWWRARLRDHFEWFDLVRIDHFRGLAAAWAVPASEPTAVHGEWRPAPGAALLQAMRDEMAGERGGGRDDAGLPLVAEDLGTITPDVIALRHQFGLPGMAVLQFAFDAHTDNPHKPENVHPDTVYYTGTHDNDTTLGWWMSLPDDARAQVVARLGVDEAGAVLDAMIATVLGSAAALSVLPMQDVLRLDNSARMNTPGREQGNWTWRFGWDALPDGLAARLREQLQAVDRCAS